MSRLSGGQTIYVRPTNNVYTVLVAVALVLEIIGMVLLFMRANVLLPGGLMGR